MVAEYQARPPWAVGTSSGVLCRWCLIASALWPSDLPPSFSSRSVAPPTRACTEGVAKCSCRVIGDFSGGDEGSAMPSLRNGQRHSERDERLLPLRIRRVTRVGSVVTPSGKFAAWMTPSPLCAGQGGAGSMGKAVYRLTTSGWKRVAYTPFGPGPGHGGISLYGYPLGIAMADDGFGLIWESRGTLYVTRNGGSHWIGLPRVARPDDRFRSVRCGAAARRRLRRSRIGRQRASTSCWSRTMGGTPGTPSTGGPDRRRPPRSGCVARHGRGPAFRLRRRDERGQRGRSASHSPACPSARSLSKFPPAASRLSVTSSSCGAAGQEAVGGRQWFAHLRRSLLRSGGGSRASRASRAGPAAEVLASLHHCRGGRITSARRPLAHSGRACA
jgi:hypothetical protein